MIPDMYIYIGKSCACTGYLPFLSLHGSGSKTLSIGKKSLFIPAGRLMAKASPPQTLLHSSALASLSHRGLELLSASIAPTVLADCMLAACWHLGARQMACCGPPLPFTSVDALAGVGLGGCQVLGWVWVGVVSGGCGRLR